MTRFNRYVAVGDSFSAGFGEPAPPAWPELAASGFRARRPDFELHNLAVAGQCARDVLDCQVEPALALEPDLVSVVCGANDVLLAIRPDLYAFADAFDEILRRLSAAAVVVTATYPEIAPRVLRERSRRRVSAGLVRLNETIRGLSTAHGARCLEWAQHDGRENPANFAGDGFHPSPRGQRLAAAAFLAAVDRFDRFEDAA